MPANLYWLQNEHWYEQMNRMVYHMNAGIRTFNGTGMNRGSRPNLFLAVIIALSLAQLLQNVSLVDTKSPRPVAI